MRDTLEVVETFRTFSGEGISLGQVAVFLRLRRCNLHCQFAGGSICDSFYTWLRGDPTYEHGYQILTTDEISIKLKELAKPRADLFVISGGEPLLWQRQLGELLPKLVPSLDELGQIPLRVEIETNGTIDPSRTANLFPQVRFNVSPKLASSGNTGLRTLVPAALRAFSRLGRDRRAIFKFVVTRDHWVQDLEEIEKLEERYGLAPIYIMPEGIMDSEIVEGLKRLAEPVLAHGWRLTPRLHITVWGNTRAR